MFEKIEFKPRVEDLFSNLKENHEVQKTGRKEKYKGGTVYKTKELAQKWLGSQPYRSAPRNYEVYGVDADWNEDVEPRSEEGRGFLLNDSKLIKLEDD